MPTRAWMAHTERMRVTFSEVDAMQHVNNAMYFTYMERVRTHYYLTLTGKRLMSEIDIIVAKASCEYHRGLRFGEDFEVIVWPSRIGSSSFDFRYVMRTASGETVATAETVQVAFDYGTEKKKPIDPGLRSRLEQELARGPGIPIPPARGTPTGGARPRGRA